MYKVQSIFIIALSFIYLLFTSCGVDPKNINEEQDTITSKKIGSFIWSTKNLDVDHFANGDLIPEAKNLQDWKIAGLNKQPAWCYYNNDLANGKKYGKLYNWYAVIDPRGLAPKGWRIPTNNDWNDLELALLPDVGLKLKSKNGWDDILSGGGDKLSDGSGNNESGLNLLPSGYCDHLDGFHQLGSSASFWTSSGYEKSQEAAYIKYIKYDENELRTSQYEIEDGFAIRCVKKDFNDEATTDSIFSETSINGKIWSCSNLYLNRFSNGDSITEAKSDEDWKKAFENRIPAWCYYFNDSAVSNNYGILYNIFAVSDPRGLAPKGWHIATNKEWEEILVSLGGDEKAIKSLKSKSGWNNEKGTDIYHYNALPGGFRDANNAKSFVGLENEIAWWSAPNEVNNDFSGIHFTNSNVVIRLESTGLGIPISNGYYVRCIKD
jgi:uncharacterized protein (TIGR02145 family)